MIPIVILQYMQIQQTSMLPELSMTIDKARNQKISTERKEVLHVLAVVSHDNGVADNNFSAIGLLIEGHHFSSPFLSSKTILLWWSAVVKGKNF